MQYPRVLDIYEFCSDALKKQLDAGRDLERIEREQEDAKRLAGLAAQEEATKPGQDVEMKDANEEVKEAKKKAVGAAAKAEEKLRMLKKDDEKLYRPHGKGLDTGNYQLVAVVTHKGRSADGGHYIGWVHAGGEDWLQCDDDIVTAVKYSDIEALAGGGDMDTAYICFYRKLEAVKSA